MKIGFICTGNSARSQMAEGFAKKFAGTLNMAVSIYSAGSDPSNEVNPFAIKVMSEKGIDISSYKPKSLEDIPYNQLDLIITLCDSARQSCPVVNNAEHIHWSLPDPAGFEGTEAEKLEVFRRVRDEIEERVWDLLQNLQLRKGNTTKP